VREGHEHLEHFFLFIPSRARARERPNIYELFQVFVVWEPEE